jgi:hypothetical protein
MPSPLGWPVAVGIALAALVGGAWQRDRAVHLLPPDPDELVYLPSAYRQAQRLEARGFGALPAMVEELGHPPLVKVIYGISVDAARAPEPDWRWVQTRAPLPDAARPAFEAARRVSAAAGFLQLGLLAVVSPVGALLLAFDPYHTKYTALAMLEGIPGLFALLAAVLLERALRTEGRGRVVLALLSAVALGAAAAGKYPYGIVLGLTLGPFVVVGFRERRVMWAAWVGALVVAFFALAPNFWLDPWRGLQDAVGFHWGFSHGEHVAESAFPWWAPLYFLTHPEPTSTHPGVFFTGVTSYLILPLAALGFARTWRLHRIFAVWALVGLAFLLAWSTKWPHYLLLVLPALAVCAGEAPAVAVVGVRKARGKLGRGARAPAH